MLVGFNKDLKIYLHLTQSRGDVNPVLGVLLYFEKWQSRIERWSEWLEQMAYYNVFVDFKNILISS